MKKMSKVLMKGNEAFAESCIRAGCRFFSGYPITPQTEILEYMSWRMEEVGGAFIQTESELAGVNMAFGAASAGARALTTSAGLAAFRRPLPRRGIHSRHIMRHTARLPPAVGVGVLDDPFLRPPPTLPRSSNPS